MEKDWVWKDNSDEIAQMYSVANALVSNGNGGLNHSGQRVKKRPWFYVSSQRRKQGNKAVPNGPFNPGFEPAIFQSLT